jgi:hypothetical protein
MTFSPIVLQIILLFFASKSSGFDEKRFGFGANRLKRKHLLKTDDNCGPTKEYYFDDAIVDHFAPASEERKWFGKGQRFWINDEYFGGEKYPIFVMIGGEGEESCSRLNGRMYVNDLAEEHGALLVDVEHRFYGESYPTEGMTTKELSYLTSNQALADLARIISHIKTMLNVQDSPVVTFGGSYPGNLAAWFRLKYPSVTIGSIASSAPVLAKTDFFEYMEVVGNSIKYFSGDSCYNAFEKAANQVASLMNEGIDSQGMKKIETDFSTCSSISSDLDLAVLLSDLMGNIQGTIQYNNERSGVWNVTDICGVMMSGDDAYQQFVNLSAIYRSMNGVDCEDASWSDTVAYMTETKKDHTNAGRPWVYQTCNEFGYYQTTNSKV